MKDLKKLRKQPVYEQIYTLAFDTLPRAEAVRDIPNVKALSGASDQFRVRVGNYRIGITIDGETVELVRALHRKEFYRYFP